MFFKIITFPARFRKHPDLSCHGACCHAVDQKLHQTEIQDYDGHCDKHGTSRKAGKLRLAQTHFHSVSCPTEFIREEFVASDFNRLQRHVFIGRIAYIEAENGRD